MKPQWIVLIVIIACGFAACNKQEPTESPEEAAARAAEEQRIADSTFAAKEAAEAAKYKWQYDVSENAMGAKNITATLTSKNTISLSFPYEGAQHGRLIIRNHTEYGKDILFTVREGQITTEKVMMRFDEENARSVGYSEPSDNSSDVIFLKGYNQLIKKFASGKKLAMQVTFYDQGSHIFEFDISNLDMDKLK